MVGRQALIGVFLVLSTQAAWADCPPRPPSGDAIVACPRVYPGSTAKLQKSESWLDWVDPGPDCSIVTERRFVVNSFWSLMNSANLQCYYSNGKILVSQVPGTEKMCIEKFHDKNPVHSLDRDATCYFRPSGDPNGDKVAFSVVKPLDRSFALFGVRLGMTALEIGDYLKKQDIAIIKSDKNTTDAALGKNKRIKIVFSPNSIATEITVEIDDNFKQKLKYPSVNYRMTEELDSIINNFTSSLGIPYAFFMGDSFIWTMYWGKPRYHGDHDYLRYPADPTATIRLEASVPIANNTSIRLVVRLTDMTDIKTEE